MKFIYSKKNVLSSELCEDFISKFESSDEKKPGVLYGKDGKALSEGKKSTDITFHPGYLNHDVWGPLLSQLVPKIEKSQNDYMIRHQLAMSKLDPFRMSPLFNLQRYEPSEGFYEYHCERASLQYSSRVLVWMLYLNTVTDGGETEFYYQNHFERPEQGTLLIWPSDWTHLHRGIPSQTQTKYILTGWFNHYEVSKN
jgi:2OG-Fe(II) oxygenase superfamily